MKGPTRKSKLTQREKTLDAVAEDLLSGQNVSAELGIGSGNMTASVSSSTKLSTDLSKVRSLAGKKGRAVRSFKEREAKQLQEVSKQGDSAPTLPARVASNLETAVKRLADLSPGAYQVAGLRTKHVKLARRFLIDALKHSKNDWLRFQSASKIMELAGVFPGRKQEAQKLDVVVRLKPFAQIVESTALPALSERNGSVTTEGAEVVEAVPVLD